MRFEKMLLDIEVQRDFFSPGGACFVRPHLQAARNVRRLFAWARRERVPVISTMLRVRPGRRGPLSPVPHCVDGTDGEKRISGALLRHYVNFGIRNVTDLPADVFGRYQQAIFEKRHTDIFAHARAERLFTQLQADTFVVCGAGSAAGIVQAVVGLRAPRLQDSPCRRRHPRPGQPRRGIRLAANAGQAHPPTEHRGDHRRRRPPGGADAATPRLHPDRLSP